MLSARSVRPVAVHSTSRVALGAIAALLLSCWTSDAAAQRVRQPQHFELDWESPPSCPQKSEVDDQIHTLLGASAGSVLPSRLRAKGVIESIGNRFQLTLSVELGQTRGARIIASDECRNLGEAAAVVLGLLVRKAQGQGGELSRSDLGGEFQTPSEPVQPDAAISPTPARKNTPPAPKEPVAPRLLPEERLQRQWYMLVRGPIATFDFWTLPNSSSGIGFAAGVLHRPWRLVASTTFWVSQERTTTGAEAYRATFKRHSAEIWGCRGWRWSTYEVSPCIVTAIDFLDVGAWSGRLTTQERRVNVFSAGAGLTGHIYLASWLSLFLSATGRFIVNRPTFVVKEMKDTEQQTHKVPPAALLTSIGAEWIF
jgi:hypothetical protein